MGHASGKRVLVVDDDPDVRDFLATCIADAGFIVETAEGSISALERIQGNVPDLITLDVVMPRRSSIRLMQKLRTREAWVDIPVILITGHAKDELGSAGMEELQAFAVHLRPKCILEKPVSAEDVVRAIAEILM